MQVRGRHRGKAQRASLPLKIYHPQHPYLLTYFLCSLCLTVPISPQAALLARRRDSAGWRVQGEAAPHAPHAWREAPPLRWPEQSMVTLGPLEIKTFRIVTKLAPAVQVAAA